MQTHKYNIFSVVGKHFFLIFKLFLIMSLVYVGGGSGNVNVSTSVPAEAKKGYQVPWNYNYRQM